MKTRKYKKRKGGLFGVRALKTKYENRENCHRLAVNFKKRDDFLHRKYNCANKYSEKCSDIGTQLGIHHECTNPKMIDAYDFSRDGLQVKQRIQEFIFKPKIQTVVDGSPWKQLTYHFNQPTESLGPYVLKTEDEINRDYKN